ncbi:MAG: hypothetical protein WD887_00150 [Candidatus Saccharimonadales bacterium]
MADPARKADDPNNPYQKRWSGDDDNYDAKYGSDIPGHYGSGGEIDKPPDQTGDLAKDEALTATARSENRRQPIELQDLDRYENQVGRGYTRPSKQKARKWLFRKRQAALGGGLIGTVIGAFFFFYFSGPLQFIHLAQLMERFHFSANQDQSDDRFVKLSRYIHHRSSGKVENVRLGYFQNKFADRIESKMNKSGIQTSYTEILGFRDGYIVDPQKLGTLDLGIDDTKNMSLAEVKASIDKRFPGLQISFTDDGKLFIDSRNMGYFKQRALTKLMMRNSGYSKVTSSIGARIMGKRAGITWHPIKKLDNKILRSAEARYLEWKTNRSKTITNGADPTLGSRADPRADPEATDEDNRRTESRASSTAAEADSVITDAQTASEGVNNGDSDAVGKFRARLGVKVALGGSSVIGVACLAKGLDDKAGEIKQAQVVMPLIRLAMEAVSLGGQVMSGDDIQMEQLGFYNNQLNGKDAKGNKTTWINAKSIQSQLGNKDKGEPADETLKTISQGTPFGFLNDGAVKVGLTPLCSTGGQVAFTVVSFLGGPVAGTAQLIVGEIINRAIMPDLAKWLAGKAVDPYVAGADYGNYVNYGSHLAANAQAMTSGGRELNDSETTQLATIQAASSQKEFNSHSFAYKLFNPYDHRSTAGQLAMNTRPDILQNVSMLASSILNPSKILASVSSLFSPKASAATGSYDFGIPKYGFSVEEINDELVKNPYKNAEDVVGSILPAHPDYIERAEKCYGVTIDPTTYDITSFDGTTPTYEDFGDEKCNDKSPTWRQVRFYIFDTQTMTSAACYEGDDQACIEVGFDISEFTSPTSPTETAVGSSQELAQAVLNLQASGRISFTTDLAKQAVEAAAAGKPSQIEARCTNAGRSSAYLSSQLLGAVVTIAKTHKLGLGYFTNGCHSAGSDHYEGRAVDINLVDGRAATGGDRDRPFMHEVTGILPEGSGMGEAQCSSISISPIRSIRLFSDSCDHIHIDVPAEVP